MVVLASLVGVVGIAWSNLEMVARGMSGMSGAGVTGSQRWTPAEFSLLATVLQWVINFAVVRSPMMVTTSPLSGGLIAAFALIEKVLPHGDVWSR